MLKLTSDEAISLLLDYPVIIGRDYGFNKLTDLHNDWIYGMVMGTGDKTLMSHRGSYKTTCVSVALACIVVAFPHEKTMFVRKTDDDTKEIVIQTKKILMSDAMQTICKAVHGCYLELDKDSATEINTNLAGRDPRGTSQIFAIGMGSSLTGKHFDRIFTDDIVNVKDRISRAERERTKLFYQELQNIKNRGGRIFNTGTPWHKDDCFCLMPPAEKYDCYNTGLIAPEELEEIRSKMVGSLFAANYELRHIASEDVIFPEPAVVDADASLAEQGIGHIDAAYGGEDYTAFTEMRRKNGKFYVYGRMWKKHIDDVEDEIIRLHTQFCGGKLYCEDNGDKGYLAKSLKAKGMRVIKYHENENKFIKISSYLKPIWNDIVFVVGTDKEYIDMICDFNENVEHDDAPDSLASAVRIITQKKEREETEMPYML